jgi:hypothetical protein
MNQQTNTCRAGISMNGAAAALWASAFVIAAFIILQAGRLQGNTANAAMAADRGSYTLMTANSGRGGRTDPDELLYVIDSREQLLMVYEIDDVHKKDIILRDGGRLDNLFVRAR